MSKKVFDPNKMKKCGSSNIEYRITNIELEFDIQNRELKVSFDIKNLIFCYFSDCQRRFLTIRRRKTGAVRISNIKLRISN